MKIASNHSDKLGEEGFGKMFRGMGGMILGFLLLGAAGNFAANQITVDEKNTPSQPQHKAPHAPKAPTPA